LEDLERLIEADYRWCVQWDKGSQTFYVRTILYPEGEHSITLSIHRFLMNAVEKHIRVDHKDHDGLNNKKSNLRVTIHSNNNQNRRGKNSNNTSGYRNVSWIKDYKKWCVQLQVDGKNKLLGKFDDVDEAGKFAEEMRKKYYGKFAGKG